MRTIRNIGIIGGAATLFLSAAVAFAQERPANIRLDTSGPGRNPSGIYRPIASTTASTTQVEIRKAALERVQAAREEAKSRITAQREKTKERLSGIRDKEKQQKAERIAEQFDKLNQKWTDHFIQQLDRYGAILLKIQERADIAATNGKDTTATNAAIKSANTAIENARTAVIAQTAKIYTLDTSAVTATASTTQSSQAELMKGLRTSFKNLHTALFKDLFALRDGPMKDTRKAVQSVLQTLEKVSGVDGGNATSTSDGANQ